ncbi:MAG: LAGLIDADG family homing endonuclease [Nanoarchaeota archaeon]
MRVLLEKESRRELFNYLMKQNKVFNLIELAKKMNIPYKTINSWRYNYKKYLPNNILNDFIKNLKILDKQPDNWGQIRGGKIGGKESSKRLKEFWGKEKYQKIKKEIGRKAIKKLQKKYGIVKLSQMAINGRLKKRKKRIRELEEKNKEFFREQKIFLNTKGIKFSRYDKMKNIKLPFEMSSELAEEIGIHLGDGCLSFNRKYFSVKTNKKEENYMINFLFPLYKKLYNLDLKLMKLPSVVGFEICSQTLFDFKNKVLGIPYGNKVEKIEVPKVITESQNKEIYRAFIRGLFDTDGCVNIIKSKKNYPVITFTIKSKKLISQTKEMLIRLGFIPYAGKWRIDINGKFMLNKWLEEIGSNNPKNLVRLKQASGSTRIE